MVPKETFWSVKYSKNFLLTVLTGGGLIWPNDFKKLLWRNKKLKKLFCSVDFNWFLREGGGGQFDQMTLKTIIKKKTEKVIL